MAVSVRRLCHWGPIIVQVMIKLITWAMIHMMGMWWPPNKTVGGAVHAMLFLLLAAATVYYFLLSLLEGPGFVPLGWRPEKEEDTQYLQFCTICNGYKAPRSHHCRQCGRCVMKMDHHCPWINCCVGHVNHGHFTKFLLFAVLGCLQASIVLSIGVYRAINRAWYIRRGTGSEPLVFLTLGTMLATLLAVGVAVGVVLAVGPLFYLQVRGILRNSTTIEDWIVEKAAARRGAEGLPPLVFPYRLPHWRANLRQALCPRGNGLSWPLAAGADQYDLTREQLAQKADKRSRARLYTATAGYGGWRLPLCSRPRAACAAPCTAEPRLPLRRADRVRVTRHRRHWLFGEKVVEGGEGRGPRGWFPRDAVVPTDELKPKEQ